MCHAALPCVPMPAKTADPFAHSTWMWSIAFFSTPAVEWSYSA
ncbi:MAG: hypothetical protein QOG20_2977 [Pseudonocardiales bacterium]|jgi:hypothetical protein|nr:hypothetical protein [Pseudonocardiales bacterium]